MNAITPINAGARPVPDTAQRLALAYKLAEQGASTVGAQLLLRASAVTYASAKGKSTAANYLRALADEMEGTR